MNAVVLKARSSMLIQDDTLRVMLFVVTTRTLPLLDGLPSPCDDNLCCPLERYGSYCPEGKYRKLSISRGINKPDSDEQEKSTARQVVSK